MADTKITALTAITTVDPAADVLPIVDVSDTSMAASGTTKKITSNQILGAGGTATLASATITGDLTVDTSTLKVDSANNFVGVGTTTGVNLAAGRGNLTIGGSSSAILNLSIGATDTGYVIHDGTSIYLVNRIAAGSLIFSTNSTERFRIDSSGQVGIGVTPSAWSSGVRAINLSTNGVLYANGGNSVFFGNNYYNDGAGTNRYLTNNVAVAYGQVTGEHQWFTAPAGTAGNVATFTQAMTLDASGNLLVGTTSASTTSGSGFKVTQPAAGHFDASIVTSANSSIYSCWDIYSTGGTAGYRFYVTSNGTINAVNTTISAISDARLKENVQDIDVGLGAILALKPRKFDWKEGKGKNIKGDRGFIAQEFEQVFPQLVDEWKDAAPEGEAPYKSVRQDLIPVLVKAIQELAAEVNALKNA